MWLKPQDWTPEQKAKSDELCRRGIFTQLLTPTQREFFRLSTRPDLLASLFYCGRKSGKSYTAFIIAIHHCVHRQNAIARIVLPSLKSAREIYFCIYGEIKQILPKDCWPILVKSESAFIFPKSNSKICLGGSDPSSIENSRGPLATLLIGDEIAAWESNNFEYALKSVLFPQLTTSRAATIYLTTPPKSPAHPFMQEYYPKLAASGNMLTMDIDQNELLSESDVELIVERYGSRQDPSFRREYLLELIAEADSRVIPEFSKELHTFSDDLDEVLPSAPDGTRDYVGYIGADLGVTDDTGIVGAVLNWVTGTLYILKEVTLSGRDENTLSNFHTHYTEMKRFISQYSSHLLEASDMFEQSRNCLHKDFGLYLPRAVKGPLEGTIGVSRAALEQGKVKIHVSCKKLIAEFETAVWKDVNATNKQIERSTEGHFDTGMAAAYLIRKVNFTARPGPGMTQNPLHNSTAPKQPAFIHSPDTVEIKKKISITKKYLDRVLNIS